MTDADGLDIFDLIASARPEHEPAKPCAVNGCHKLRQTRGTVWCPRHRANDMLNGQAVAS